jgi:hypothetical protein
VLSLNYPAPSTAERVGRRLLGASQAPAPQKVMHQAVKQPLAGGDPLLDGAVRLFSIALRHVYAALWRVGVLEVQAQSDGW